MRCRPVDEYGDMMPVQYASQMLEEAHAVAAAVNSRMTFFKGDWWEDRTVGFSVPDFLITGLKGETGAQMLLNYIVAYILQTEGVLRVERSSYHVSRRHMSCNIAVKTIYGEVVEGSVGMDELLGAIPG